MFSQSMVTGCRVQPQCSARMQYSFADFGPLSHLTKLSSSYHLCLKNCRTCSSVIHRSFVAIHKELTILQAQCWSGNCVMHTIDWPQCLKAITRNN